ncbi:MAG TPA: sugar ABC transporter permease [Devosiaceae bacterium]|jgi:multiple sugar transport system permease protein
MTQELSLGKAESRPAWVAKGNPRAERNKAAYVMLLPWLIGFFCLTAIPMLATLFLSFTDYSLLSPPEWVGLENYQYMFGGDYRFWPALSVTIFYVFVSVPLATVIALLVALGLNRQLRGVGILRSVYYLPSLLGGSVAVAIMWRELFDQNGLVNSVLGFFGIAGPAWLAVPNTAPWTLVFLHAWQFGSPMVIFLAALKQIPADLYEAAELDDANAVQKFFTLTLPLITPIIFFNVVMQMIVSFQAFTPAFIISNGTGAPLDATLFYTLYLYIEGFGNFHMGYAAAMAWVLLAIIAVLTGIAFLTARFWVFNPDD